MFFASNIFHRLYKTLSCNAIIIFLLEKKHLNLTFKLLVNKTQEFTIRKFNLLIQIITRQEGIVGGTGEFYRLVCGTRRRGCCTNGQYSQRTDANESQSNEQFKRTKSSSAKNESSSTRYASNYHFLVLVYTVIFIFIPRSDQRSKWKFRLILLA